MERRHLLVCAAALSALSFAQVGCGYSSDDEIAVAVEARALQVSGASQLVTWTCTGSPCPWGATLDGQAVVWPDALQPIRHRMGYTVSQGIYLPNANGVTITVQAGTATAFAGLPDESSHHALGTITAGQTLQITGVATGEVVSVQGDASFTFDITVPPPPPSDAGTPVVDAGPPADAGAAPDAGAPAGGSTFVTWTCTGSPCPWGPSTTGYAIAWPAVDQPVSVRLGYTVSAGVYLPAAKANGATVSILTGTATAYAGLPDATSHRALGTINAGQSQTITGLLSGEVLSVQSDAPFTSAVTFGTTPPPLPDDTVYGVPAFWRCNTPGCTDTDWTGAAVDWPSWSAYNSNGRSGGNSRSVYSAAGVPLYPYMGAWANGCKVTSRGGDVLIIEWQRGADVWTETLLKVGESHVITLVPPQDGAMIETPDGESYIAVGLENCTPQPLQPGHAPATPSGVTAAAGDGQVTVSWNAVAGATSYDVYWATSPGVTTASTKLQGATSPFVHTGRTNGATYYYRVSAVSSTGESALSAEVSATPAASALPAPAAPTGVIATAGNAQATVSWTAVSGASSYNLYWATAAGVTVGSASIHGVTSPFVQTGLTNGTTYFYRVTALNAAGESALSAEVSARPVAPPPGIPTGVAAVAGNAQVTISWAAVSGATSYNLYWATAAGVTLGSTRIQSVTRPFVHTGRTNGTTYFYRVTALSAGGESALSAEVKARPVGTPSTPTGVRATAGTRQVTVSWTAVSGATSYNVYWSTSPGVTLGSNRIQSVTNPFVHAGRTRNVTYYYRVTALNANGESALSAEVSARAR
ncbi:MAG TPA: fibronectin type III domain-containing protein [Polyangia bacterium]|nr:fibronectin type III domain-containing protein [Polyangia bacterium]